MVKKKLAVLGLAAVMTVAFMPAMAFADAADSGGSATQSTVSDTQTDQSVASKTVNGTTKYYSTLAEAFNSVGKGETAEIKLLKDSEGDGLIIEDSHANYNENITVDFGGHTYTPNEGVGSKGYESQGVHLIKGNTVTFKNGTLAGDPECESVAMLIQNYANLTLDNFDLNTQEDYNISYALSSNNGNVNIIGSSNIYANSSQYAFDSCESSRNYPDGSHVTVDTTGSIYGMIQYDPASNTDVTRPVSSITIKNGTFYNALEVDSKLSSVANSNIKVEGGTYYNNSLPSEYVTNNTPVATITSENDVSYVAVGITNIKKAAEDSSNTVTITKGSVSLTGANAKIANDAGNKTGTVTVDGTTVKAGGSVQPNAAQTIANLKSEIASLKSQLAQAQASASSAQSTSNDSARQITQLKKDLADAQAQLKTAQEQAASQGSTLTAPAKVMNLKVKAGKKSAKLSWTALKDNATGYRIYRKTKGGKYAKVKTITKTSTSSWTNKGLKKGKTYYYKVRAYKSITSGELWGAYSNTAKAVAK